MTQKSLRKNFQKSGSSRVAASFSNVNLNFLGYREVLHDVSFELEAGGFVFVTGNSGSGKTSLMRLLHIDLMPTSGKVKIFGNDIDSLSREARAEIRRNVGVVFQNFRLMSHLSVFENLALPLVLRNYPWKKIKKYTDQMLEWVGLESWRNAEVMRLSGGQQQLVAVARAVIFQPRLLLADEPTGNVDDMMAKRLMFLFDELNKLGMTVVLATHNFSLIDKFPRRILRINKGRVSLSDYAAENK